MTHVCRCLHCGAKPEDHPYTKELERLLLLFESSAVQILSSPLIPDLDHPSVHARGSLWTYFRDLRDAVRTSQTSVLRKEKVLAISQAVLDNLDQ